MKSSRRCGIHIYLKCHSTHSVKGLGISSTSVISPKIIYTIKGPHLKEPTKVDNKVGEPKERDTITDDENKKIWEVLKSIVRDDIVGLNNYLYY